MPELLLEDFEKTVDDHLTDLAQCYAKKADDAYREAAYMETQARHKRFEAKQYSYLAGEFARLAGDALRDLAHH